MPKRTHNQQQDALETSTTSPECDIPWFANFGKFVDNTDFFVYNDRNDSSQVLQSDSYETINASETSSHAESQNNMHITPISSATELNVPPRHAISNDVMQIKPTHRRASSAAVLPTGASRGFSPHSRSRNDSRPSRSSRAEEETPKTLGAILRRMVSFDQYSTKNRSKEQEQLDSMYGQPTNFGDARFRVASENPHLFPTDQSDMLPPTVPLHEADDRIGHMPRQMVEPSIPKPGNSSAARQGQVGHRGRHCDSEPPKTLGAILRKMVSFDQYSKRSLSRAHELPLHGRDGNNRSGVATQETRRYRRRGDDLEAQVRTMRRW